MADPVSQGEIPGNDIDRVAAAIINDLWPTVRSKTNPETIDPRLIGAYQQYDWDVFREFAGSALKAMRELNRKPRNQGDAST